MRSLIMKSNILKLAIPYFLWFFLIFHIIGAGIFLYLDAAPQLSFLNIFISSVLVFLAEKNLRRALPIFFFIFCAGYIIELVGIQTGYLFGDYYYIPAMGPRIYGTPIIIGATWYAVVVGASNIAWYVKGSVEGRALLAGLLTVLMDILIEKVAMHYGMWQWSSGTVPLFNYLCWFAFGSIFAYAYLKMTEQKNKTAIYLFLIWVGFFSVLTLFR